MELKTVNKDYALKFIPQIESFKDDFPSDNCSFFFLSDEWYILSELDLPDSKEYGEFDLIENGVGQVRNFLNIY